jgi:DNA invertase Pin-like site-specific DNA recombinase
MGIVQKGVIKATMKIGYARVSTDEQHLDLQRQALEAEGCAKIYEDRGVSGASTERNGLLKALRAVKAGDILVVWKLDRLGRSLSHLLEMISGLRRKEVGFQSLQEQIDTTSAGGRFYMHILAALAEFEREMIRDRTTAGMQAAKRRGVKLGRPVKLDAEKLTDARKMLKAGISRKAVAETLQVSPLTLRRALAVEKDVKLSRK